MVDSQHFFLAFWEHLLKVDQRTYDSELVQEAGELLSCCPLDRSFLISADLEHAKAIGEFDSGVEPLPDFCWDSADATELQL